VTVTQRLDEDAARLAELGYESEFSREMSRRANFALGFTSASPGIYVAFQMVVLAALRARLRAWEPKGAFRLGRWGLAVNVAALVYGVGAGLNLAWPRTPDVAWYDNWIAALSTAIVLGGGLLYMLVARPWERSTAAAGDAVEGGT
jgi:amino acid transporter